MKCETCGEEMKQAIGFMKGVETCFACGQRRKEDDFFNTLHSIDSKLERIIEFLKVM